MLIPVHGSEKFANRPHTADETRKLVPAGFRLHTVEAAAAERLDPLTYEVIRHRLSAITEEMADAIRRMSGSIVVVECNDFNTCIMDELGQAVQMGSTARPSRPPSTWRCSGRWSTAPPIPA